MRNRLTGRASNLALANYSIAMAYENPAPDLLLPGRPTGIGTERVFVVFSDLPRDLRMLLASKTRADGLGDGFLDSRCALSGSPLPPTVRQGGSPAGATR